MALKVTYCDAGFGVVLEAVGHLTGAELIEEAERVNPYDPAIAHLYSLFDFDGVQSVNISTADLREAAEISVAAAPYNVPGRVVAIHAGDNLQFGLARMWMVFVEHAGWETNVFRNRVEAVAWIKERVAARFGRTVTVA